jgi:hypothetical protein
MRPLSNTRLFFVSWESPSKDRDMHCQRAALASVLRVSEYLEAVDLESELKMAEHSFSRPA